MASPARCCRAAAETSAVSREPSLAATSTVALCCSALLLLSSLFQLCARQLWPKEAVCGWRAVGFHHWSIFKSPRPRLTSDNLSIGSSVLLLILFLASTTSRLGARRPLSVDGRYILDDVNCTFDPKLDQGCTNSRKWVTQELKRVGPTTLFVCFSVCCFFLIF